VSLRIVGFSAADGTMAHFGRVEKEDGYQAAEAGGELNVLSGAAYPSVVVK
jgi:hypothetical protein